MTGQYDTPTEPSSEQNSVVITGVMIESLGQTKPWVNFLAVMGFLGVAFMVISGVLIMFGATKFDGGPGGMVMMGFLYILCSLLYFFPSVFLYNYSCAIGRFINEGKTRDLEESLSAQKSFWKFVGVYTLVCLGLALLGFVLAIILPLLF